MKISIQLPCKHMNIIYNVIIFHVSKSEMGRLEQGTKEIYYYNNRVK